MILRQRKWKGASGFYQYTRPNTDTVPCWWSLVVFHADKQWEARELRGPVCPTATHVSPPGSPLNFWYFTRHPAPACARTFLFFAFPSGGGGRGCRRIRHVTDQCHEDRLHPTENDRKSLEAQHLCRLQTVVQARRLKTLARHNTVFPHVFSLACVECGGHAGTAQLCILRRVTSFTVSCQLATAAAATCSCLGSGRSGWSKAGLSPLKCFKCFSLKHNFSEIMVSSVLFMYSFTGQFCKSAGDSVISEIRGKFVMKPSLSPIRPSDQLSLCNYIIISNTNYSLEPVQPKPFFFFNLQKKLIGLDFYVSLDKQEKKICIFFYSKKSISFQLPRMPRIDLRHNACRQETKLTSSKGFHCTAFTVKTSKVCLFFFLFNYHNFTIMHLAVGALSLLRYQHHSWGWQLLFGRLTVSSCHYFPQWKLKQAQRKICCGNTRSDEPEAEKPCAVKEANASTSFHQ